MTRLELEHFVDELPQLVNDNHIWPAAPGSGESGHDRIALQIREWLPANAKHLLCAEGLSKRGLECIPRELRGRFLGSWNWPDIALVHDDLKVAIEVDRGRGKGGASVRTAMTKGSFSVLTGGFDCCLVFVFQEPGCNVELSQSDKDVLEQFAQPPFRTKVCFFKR
jgi:hypothetical protein